MNVYAQTNIQLFDHLRREGYSRQEISRVVDAYQLAMHLFTGLFQPSGKTFIDHLVGTASILASLHAAIEIVVAGLIHAAYDYGDFGGGRKGVSHAKRAIVRGVVGEKVEDYVARYAALKWSRKRAVSIYNGFDALGPMEREVLLMRLANSLELRLDLAFLYFGDTRAVRQSIEHDGELLCAMARELGYPTLAAELNHMCGETALSDIYAEFRNRNGRTSAYLIGPRSYRRPPSLFVWRHFERHLNRFSSFRKYRALRQMFFQHTGR